MSQPLVRMVGMKRRTFLQRLIATVSLAPGLIASGRNEVSPADTIKLSTLRVAGLRYGACADSRFIPGETLTLVREPHNSHDPWAVRIDYRGLKVGYIPRTHSRIVASLIDGGYRLEARVRHFHPERESWERLWVSVWMEEKI